MLDIKAFDLNQLKLLKKIGVGSFGTVYQAQSINDGEFLAAKVSSEYTNDLSDENIKNQKREVTIISKVNHPLILKFIGYSPVDFHNEKKHVIITEFIKNFTLKSFIDCDQDSRASFYWNDTRKLINIYGIAAALSYLHLHNILHRDLKPSNILIDDYLLPKIADFGLSKINHKNLESFSSNSVESSDVKGTAIYISPEIYENANYSEAGDAYAFAMIVYQIMTKCTPFKGCTFFEIFKKVTSEIRQEFNKSIPSSYRSLIEDCWAQKPEDRPNFNSILARLKSDSGFITETIDKQHFANFVNYIDQLKNGGDVISID